MKRLMVAVCLGVLMVLAACEISVGDPGDPGLEVGATNLDFGQNSAKRLTVSNTGGGELEVTVETSEQWLEVSASSFVLGAGESGDLIVSINRFPVERDPGSYSGTVQLSSSGDNVSVTANMQVSGFTPPDLCNPSSSSLAATNTSTASTNTLPEDRPLYVPGQLLVRYQDGLSAQSREDAARSLQAQHNLQLLRRGGAHLPDLVSISASGDVQTLADTLSRDARVDYAEPNYYVYPMSLPNDPFLDEQWALCNFGVPNAWEIETGQDLGRNTTIAVIDSGVDTNHEDLVDKLLPGYDFCSQSSGNCDLSNVDDDPNTNDAHGTHVAGIAAAQGNNNTGIAGMAYTGS